MIERTCGRCGNKAFRRVNRRGWMQRVLLPKLGFWPWECVHCRRRVFFRDAGVPKDQREKPFY